MGLREDIKNAVSSTDVESLLNKGKSFEFASNRTRQSWKSTARFRIVELTNPVPAQNSEKPVKSEKKKTVKKKN